MKIFRRILIIFTSLFLIMVCFLGYAAYQNYSYQNPETKTVLIPKGTTVRKITLFLEKEQIIKNRFFFEIYLRLTDLANGLKAGEYDFSKGLRQAAVANMLYEGRVKTYTFTIPEGYSLHKICETFLKKGLLDLERCLGLTDHTSLLRGFAGGAKNLEGYLFPETYIYDKLTDPEKLIFSMVDMFFQKVDSFRIAKAKEKNLTPHELITLASIVEKETGLATERPLIAAVFLNRLQKGMALQSDPTVIYGIKDFDGNLTKTHLQTDTPYNTYLRTGLPPGPICSPGLSAIDAVLNPENTQALYFVAKGDGSHYFSETLMEHSQAVRYYQLKQGPAPAE